VFCCNRSDLPLDGHALPGEREYGDFLVRFNTLGRIRGSPSAVHKTGTRRVTALRQRSSSLLERDLRISQPRYRGSGQKSRQGRAAASIATSRSGVAQSEVASRSCTGSLAYSPYPPLLCQKFARRVRESGLSPSIPGVKRIGGKELQPGSLTTRIAVLKKVCTRPNQHHRKKI
jgi:hypothetical protein